MLLTTFCVHSLRIYLGQGNSLSISALPEMGVKTLTIMRLFHLIPFAESWCASVLFTGT